LTQDDKKTLEILRKKRATISPTKLFNIRQNIDRNRAALKEDIRLRGEKISNLENLLYYLTGTQLSKFGFDTSAVNWAMHPARENLMKRRNEEMLEDVASVNKFAKVSGGSKHRNEKSQRTARRKRKSKKRRKRSHRP